MLRASPRAPPGTLTERWFTFARLQYYVSHYFLLAPLAAAVLLLGIFGAKKVLPSSTGGAGITIEGGITVEGA